MSGYRHSGMSREDYEDRVALLDAVSVIERRWPEKNTIRQLLESLIRKIETEA